MQDIFKTFTPVENYTYENMIRDLCSLEREFRGSFEINTIGKSEEGRSLFVAKLGSPDAAKAIFINASIHAREHMTTSIAMAQIEHTLRSRERDLLEDACFHFVPMANPDGVFISQTGILPQKFEDKYTFDIAKRWKANSCGIDLNANFDGNWKNHGDGKITAPAPEGFKGCFPECAKESKALADYARNNHFDITLSYHSTGSQIFYKFGDSKTNILCESLALAISRVTGFELYLQDSKSSAGFKDWAIDKLGIPSLTIEFGRLCAPHTAYEFENMWQSAKKIPKTLVTWLKKRKFFDDTLGF